ncbi:MAG: AMP-binding protein [Treponema sp.]|nr:AMP-binding protein [Treponema sp.]
MLEFKDYIADWPDFTYPNFSVWLDSIAAKWKDKAAILYRTDGKKDFTRWSFTRLAEESYRIGRGLLAAGLTGGERVVLWCENRPEWMAVWLGAAIAGLVIVPVDFLVSENECANILKITRAKAFFYSARKKSLADSLAGRGIETPVLVSMAGDGENTYGSFGINAANTSLPKAADFGENDPVSIVFTSGTTGFAKGVTLSHKNIISNASAAVLSLKAQSDDVFINVLPLHHTYPTTCSFIAPLMVGAATIIVEKLVGSVVVDDIHDAGGTFLIAVPLLYDKVMAAIDKGFKEQPLLFQKVLNIFRAIALAEAKHGRPGFGRVFFKFVRKRASLDSIRMMVAGGGPLSPKTADFFDSFGFNMVHGYGMSENSPLISVNTPRHKNNVSVGLPVKYTEVEILEKDKDGIGEIAVRSPSVMLGYFENVEATKEVLTEDGWLKTGDLGYRDKTGYIYINGRAKNLIVSSGGKNIYPEEIEGHFSDSKTIAEILIIGRKERQYGGEQVFAVTVPNYETLAVDYPGKENDEAFVRDLIKKEIERVNRTLVGYKKITDFVIRREPFEKNAQQKIRRFMYKSYSEPKK